MQTNRLLFQSTAIGLSEWEARFNARKWETLFKEKYKIGNLKLVKKPSFLQRLFHPFTSGYYRMTFDVYENKEENARN